MLKFRAGAMRTKGQRVSRFVRKNASRFGVGHEKRLNEKPGKGEGKQNDTIGLKRNASAIVSAAASELLCQERENSLGDAPYGGEECARTHSEQKN